MKPVNKPNICFTITLVLKPTLLRGLTLLRPSVGPSYSCKVQYESWAGHTQLWQGRLPLQESPSSRPSRRTPLNYGSQVRPNFELSTSFCLMSILVFFLSISRHVRALSSDSVMYSTFNASISRLAVSRLDTACSLARASFSSAFLSVRRRR